MFTDTKVISRLNFNIKPSMVKSSVKTKQEMEYCGEINNKQQH